MGREIGGVFLSFILTNSCSGDDRVSPALTQHYPVGLGVCSASSGGTDWPLAEQCQGRGHSPAARQEFRWTEEKKQTLELGPVATSDRQDRVRALWPRGPSVSGQSGTWLSSPGAAIHARGEGGLNDSPIQRLRSSEVQL